MQSPCWDASAGLAFPRSVDSKILAAEPHASVGNLTEGDAMGGLESRGVLILIFGTFVLNLLTYNEYPNVWCDEATFSEPAINFVKYHSFNIYVWQHQPFGTFFASNCPLYSMMLAGWLGAFGTSLLAVRSLNFALLGLAAYLLWRAMGRLGLVNRPGARLMAIALAQMGYGFSFAYRCSRPDVLGAVAVLLLLLSFTMRQARWRQICMMGAGALTVWVGLQVAVFGALGAGLAWGISRFLKRIGKAGGDRQQPSV